MDAWLESGDESLKDELHEQLSQWVLLDAALESAFEQYPFLKEVEPHAGHLSRLSKLAMDALDESQESKPAAEELSLLLTEARKAHGATLLSGISGFERLIKESGNPISD